MWYRLVHTQYSNPTLEYSWNQEGPWRIVRKVDANELMVQERGVRIPWWEKPKAHAVISAFFGGEFRLVTGTEAWEDYGLQPDRANECEIMILGDGNIYFDIAQERIIVMDQELQPLYGIDTQRLRLYREVFVR